MTSKQLFYSVAGTLLLSAMVTTPFLVNTNAQTVDGANDGSQDGRPHYRRRQKNKDVVEALKSGDYETWAEAVAETPRGEYMLERITADNFDSFVEMIELYRADDTEAADAIAVELGLPTQAERREFKTAMREAFSNGDYDAYLAVVESREDYPEDFILSEEEFNEKVASISEKKEKFAGRRADFEGRRDGVSQN